MLQKNSRLDNFFHLTARKTDIKQEILAGVTTFLSMAYILAVNPEILGSAGMDKTAVFTATVLASIVGTLVMGLFANLPIALAPGMGLNAFFTYTVVLAWHIPWQTALSGVFVAGLLFMLLSFTKMREQLIDIIPSTLKYAVSAGIGLFISFSGLINAQIIVPDKTNGVALGNLHDPVVLLAVIGILITLVLVIRGVLGGIFIGMVITTIIGIIFGVIAVPRSIIGGLPSLHPLFAQSLFSLSNVFSLQMIVVILTFFLVGIFDTAGTIMGVVTQGGLIDEKQHVLGGGRALVTGAVATTIGAVLGTSTTTAYAESTSGVAAGGRTGLTAIVTAFLFALSSIFAPLLAVVTSAVTVPALIIVGILMMKNVQYIDWNKMELAVPAFFTIIMMVLTFSISEGLAFGFILYPLTMLLKRRAKEVHPMMYALMVLFIAYFIFII